MSNEADFDLKTKAGRIAYAIKASHHTPASIAMLTGCAAPAVYQWINGSTKNLKEEHLWKLSDVTGFDARWISTGEGMPRPYPCMKHVETVLKAMEPEARYTAVRLIDAIAMPAKKDLLQ
jgi:hypothetical protein